MLFLLQKSKRLTVFGPRIARFPHIQVSGGLYLIHTGVSLPTAFLATIILMDGLDALKSILLLVLEALVYLLEYLMLDLAC